MPSYTFRNELTGEESTMSMTIAEMEEFLEKHDWIKWVPRGSPPVLDSVRLGIKKPDEGFRDILRAVKKGNPRSSVNTF